MKILEKIILNISKSEAKIVEEAGAETITLEYLACGHQNNLALAGNKSGVCPVCEKEI